MSRCGQPIVLLVLRTRVRRCSGVRLLRTVGASPHTKTVLFWTQSCSTSRGRADSDKSSFGLLIGSSRSLCMRIGKLPHQRLCLAAHLPVDLGELRRMLHHVQTNAAFRSWSQSTVTSRSCNPPNTLAFRRDWSVPRSNKAKQGWSMKRLEYLMA